MYITCDIGGTHTRMALADKAGLKSEPVIFDTPEAYRQGVSKIIQKMKEMSDISDIEAVSIGAAGSLMKDNSGFFNSPNLPDWNKKPLCKTIADAVQAPVYLENDTALVGLGEAVFGAGKDNTIVAYHTVSTGVGGTRVVDGRLDEHALGFEPGHQIIFDPENPSQDADTVECPSCHLFGHLEGLIGGASLEKKHGQKPSEITNENVWDDAARYLAYGLNNTLVYWSPDIIVLGGGLIMHDAIKIDRVKVYLERIIKIFPEIPPIVRAELEDVGGLYGGIAFIQNQT